MELIYRNVNDAFKALTEGFHTGRVRRDCGYEYQLPLYVQASRYGEVITCEQPVMITYKNPLERVLFNSGRDANPFFHLYEALWMLAGRNDVASVAFYASRMKEFSDDGKTVNGAYGYRWRTHYYGEPRRAIVDEDDWRNRESVDQLDTIVQHFKANPLSRRAVLTMWNVEDDLLKVDTSRDVCCNTHAYFRVRCGLCPVCKGRGYIAGLAQREECRQCKGKPHECPSYLDLTVCNRSNDLIWGALGSNAVHFSILLEYMAARTGLEVGEYHQFTNDLHVYTDRWDYQLYQQDIRDLDSYYDSCVRLPLVSDPAAFDEEVKLLVDCFRGEVRNPRPEVDQLSEVFLRRVAAPMFRAFELHRLYRETAQAIRMCDLIGADDWRRASREWLQRRLK